MATPNGPCRQRSPNALGYTSRRGRVELRWAIVLTPATGRTQLRLRLA
jgi:hypothetical protein